MKLSKLVLAFVCLAALTAGCFAQSDASKSHGIPGYLDPETGAFKPFQSQTEAIDLAKVTPTTGKFVFSFTVTVASTIATATKILCQADATVTEPTTFFTASEIAAVTATRSGSTATCTVTIPYSWPLTTASKDIVNLAFSISAGTPGSTTTSYRISTQTAGTIPVPATGSTTSLSFSPTI
jgi:hypothetical protein